MIPTQHLGRWLQLVPYWLLSPSSILGGSLLYVEQDPTVQ